MSSKMILPEVLGIVIIWGKMESQAPYIVNEHQL